MINSPCNPTGTVYTRSELEALADVVLGTEAGILSDEIYEQLTYGDAKPTCIATLRPQRPRQFMSPPQRPWAARPASRRSAG